MKRFMLKVLLSVFLMQTTYSFGQALVPIKNPPLTMETLIGDRGLTYQIMINKKFQSAPRFGFFSVSSLVGEWNSRKVDDLMIQGHLTFDLLKGVSVNAGFHQTTATGIRPTASMMYSYATPRWLVVVFPRVDLDDKPNVELFSLVEYKPKINDKLKFYSRVQGMYVYNPSMDAHQKSGLALRAGLTLKEFTFGAGFNADSYGPMKHNMNNIGGFVSVYLF